MYGLGMYWPIQIVEPVGEYASLIGIAAVSVLRLLRCRPWWASAQIVSAAPRAILGEADQTAELCRDRTGSAPIKQLRGP
jgi:hypothetical protein